VNQSLIGSIYTLRDASSTSDCGHNYIIISNNQNINKFVQAMPITSMRNKKVTIEVPIMLSNGLVSYIVPYSIQTFTSTELKVGKFRGCISDTKYISSKEFINLLMDMYLAESNIGDVDKNKVMDEYKNYDFVINIQGDEPLIDIESINILANNYRNEKSEIVTLKQEMKLQKDIENPNHVKVITDFNDNAVYFSRSVIPYERNASCRGRHGLWWLP